MRVLILGSDTPLGQALLAYLERKDRHEVTAFTRANCRWKSERQAKKAVVRSACEALVDLRVSAALDAGEDLQELDTDRCHWLAKACQRNLSCYLYLSSSRLFSGKLDRLYSEQDSPDSSEKIAQSLVAAERLVSEGCQRHLVLRLGPVFAADGNNWLPQMMARLASPGSLVLDSNLRGNPVAAADAARVVSALLDQLSAGAEPWGIYHYCSADNANASELAEALLAAAGQFSSLDLAGVELDRTQDAHLPRNRSLDCRKIRNTFAVKQVPWRECLTQTVEQYFQTNRN